MISRPFSDRLLVETETIKSAYSKKYYRTLPGHINKHRDGLDNAYRDFLLQRLA